jgi:hypothetical protein
VPRSYHSVTDVFGDTFLVFGGVNSQGFLNDFYIYNFMSNEWSQLDYSNSPSQRAGACMVLMTITVYIYGGYNDNGSLDDFWKVSMYGPSFQQLFTSGVTVPPLQNHICVTRNDSTLIILSGESLNNQANPSVFLYKNSENTWHIIFSSSSLAVADAAFLDLNPHILLLGGRKNIAAKSDIYLISTNQTWAGSLPFPMAGHAAQFAGRSVYIFGGLKTVGKAILQNTGTSTFIKLKDEALGCSYGYASKNCTICEPGFYSSSSNAAECEQCKPGTYSESYGQRYFTQCFPCPFQTFSSINGSKMCLSCDTYEYCPIGSVAPAMRITIPTVASVQPRAYDTSVTISDSDNSILIVALASVLGVLLIGFFFFQWTGLFKKFDIYQENHERKYFEEPFSTSWGGLFSIFFIVTAGFFIISPLLYFAISNITETKSLVSSLTLENQQITAKNGVLTITLFNFGGVCGDNTGFCDNKVSISLSGLAYSIKTGPFCYSIGTTCIINFTCTDCDVPSSATMQVNIFDFLLYTSGIQVNFTLSSSLPDFNTSSISLYLAADDDKVFNGLTPNYFYITMIPSVTLPQVFYSESANWENNVTGYHLIATQSPKAGSTVDNTK